ncbi:MAG: hypothetical protein JRF71_15305 [Deltaproteobacteria bacterium]|nr:hypothetical protein [Deltaproteobacteria bacterium]
MENNDKKPWTRNQKITVFGFIFTGLCVIIAAFFGKPIFENGEIPIKDRFQNGNYITGFETKGDRPIYIWNWGGEMTFNLPDQYKENFKIFDLFKGPDKTLKLMVSNAPLDSSPEVQVTSPTRLSLSPFFPREFFPLLDEKSQPILDEKGQPILGEKSN